MRIPDYTFSEIAENAALFRSTSRNSTQGDEDRLDPLAKEYEVLQSLGFGKPTLDKARRAATLNGSTIEEELLANGISSRAYYESIAGSLGVEFLDKIPVEWVHDAPYLDTQLLGQPLIRISRPESPPSFVMTPSASALPQLAQKLANSSQIPAACAIAPPEVIRDAIWAAGASRRLRETTEQLFDDAPHFSARTVMTGGQGFAAGLALCLLATWLALYPGLVLLTLHLVFSLFYASTLAVRFIALSAGQRRAKSKTFSGPLPIYTVLVALHREADVVPQLVRALRRLDWPATRLDIKLICEADDQATIAAVQEHASGPQFEIVEVPFRLPRTKPKALSYALPAARGEYLVIYDAEDRPHPGQLREAYSKFRRSDHSLACVQAPLVISNASASWVSGIFALEYSGLFRLLLPALARFRLPLPLGGTSNHFKTVALKSAGGWDPYNVTEDADLGIRLCRLGYHCDVIDLPTIEDAPENVATWMNQRIRWYKGWLQTMLVHLRTPVNTARELTYRGSATIILMIGGMLLSALTHPLLLIFAGMTVYTVASGNLAQISLSEKVFFLLDGANIIGSYVIFLVIGRKAMIGMERQRLGRRWIALPLYWMLLSIAAWRSLHELITRPHFWRKTPHEPTRNNTQND